MKLGEAARRGSRPPAFDVQPPGVTRERARTFSDRRESARARPRAARVRSRRRVADRSGVARARGSPAIGRAGVSPPHGSFRIGRRGVGGPHGRPPDRSRTRLGTSREASRSIAEASGDLTGGPPIGRRGGGGPPVRCRDRSRAAPTAHVRCRDRSPACSKSSGELPRSTLTGSKSASSPTGTKRALCRWPGDRSIGVG